MSRTPILTHEQIRQRITRLAYEIWEANFGAAALRLVGVHRNGYRLAELLAAELRVVAPDLTLHLTRLTLEKDAPLRSAVVLEPPLTSLANERVVLVDDVLNSGRTLAYALPPLLALAPDRVQTLLLVDRHHPRFPVAATFTGLSLSTTLAERVEVELPETGDFAAWLV